MAALVRQKEIAMTKTSAPTNSRTNSQTSASLILRTTVPAIVMSLAILLSALPTNAQDQQTGTAGGNGGTPFTINCPNGKAMIGLGGSTFAVGNFVDSLFGRCSSVQPGGDRFGNVTSTNIASAPGGSTIGTCPDNQVVSGIRVFPSVVTAGTLVGGISLFCRALGNDGRTTGGASIGPGMTGGAGFSTPVDLQCPNNLPAKGFFGQSGDFVDRVGLVCALPDVSAPEITSFTLSSAAVTGSQNVTASITLDKPVPPSGTDIALSDNGGAAVTFASNPLHLTSGNSGTVQVRTNPVAAVTNVTVTAAIGQSNRTAALQVNPPAVIRITFNPGQVTGGSSLSGQVLLSGPSPANGFSVNLTNSNPNIALKDATFAVPFSGQNSANFEVGTRPVGSDATITMAANQTVSGTFKVLAPRIQSLTLSAVQVVAGTSVTGTATLTGPPPSASFSGGGGTIGGTVSGPRLNISGMALNSSNTSAATVPAAQMVTSNPTSFTVSTSGVSSAQCSQITANFNSVATAFIGVTPAASSSNLGLSIQPGSVVNLGGSINGTVSFGGTIFGATLTSSNPNVATVSPNSVSSVKLQVGSSGNAFTVNGVSAGCSMITARHQNAIGQVFQSSTMVVVRAFVSGKLSAPLPNFEMTPFSASMRTRTINVMSGKSSDGRWLSFAR